MAGRQKGFVFIFAPQTRVVSFHNGGERCDEWVRLTMSNILGNLVRVKKHGYNPPRNVNWLSILEPAAEITASHFCHLRLMWLDLFRSFHNSHHHFAKTHVKSVIFPGEVEAESRIVKTVPSRSKL